MNNRTAIETVAGLVGIEPRYTDGLDRTREVSDCTLLALIEAFGLPADPARAMSALTEEERSVPLGLSPVHFVDAEATQPALALRLPAGCRQILWSCCLENGKHHSGPPVAVSGKEGERFPMPLPERLPLGYHRLD